MNNQMAENSVNSHHVNNTNITGVINSHRTRSESGSKCGGYIAPIEDKESYMAFGIHRVEYGDDFDQKNLMVENLEPLDPKYIGSPVGNNFETKSSMKLVGAYKQDPKFFLTKKKQQTQKKGFIEPGNKHEISPIRNVKQ